MTREAEAVSAAPGRSVLVNSVASMGSSLVAWIVQAAVVVAAVRTFGVAEWGHYATATSLIAIFIALSQAGIGTTVLRELSARREEHNSWLAAALLAVCATSLVAMVCLVPLGLALGYDHQVIDLLAIGTGSIVLIGVTEVLRPAFTSRHLMIFGAAFDMVGLLAFAIAATVVLALGGSPYELLAASVAGNAVTLVCAVALLRRTNLRPRLATAYRRVLPVLRAAVPLAGVTLASTVYDRLDVIMLSKLGSATEVAHYSVVYTLTKFTWFVPTVIVTAIYPRLVAELHDDPGKARETLLLTLRGLLVIGLPIALFLSLAGHDFLPWFFGSGYSESGDLLALMAWNTVLVYVSFVMWYGMIASGLERLGLRALLASLLLNAGVNAALIPSHGATGAAIALVSAALLLSAAQTWIVHTHVFPIPFIRVIRTPLATAAVAVPAGLVVSAAVADFVGGVCGGAVWLALLLGARYVEPGDLAPLFAALRRRSR